MSDDDTTPDNWAFTGKPWEPDYSHLDPDVDMQGPHLQVWILVHETETFLAGTSQQFTWERPVYVPMGRSFRSRNNATYHAKRAANPDYGSAGFMVKACNGGPECAEWQMYRGIEADDGK